MLIARTFKQVSHFVNKKHVFNSIHSYVLFPKAENFTSERMIHEIEVESYHSKEIKMALERDAYRLISLYANDSKQDIIEACDIIDEMMAKSAPIDRIRFIQINKSGVDLLRIKKIGNEKMERLVFLNINEYKRAMLEEFDRYTIILYVTGMAASFMVVGFIMGM